ncbi:MAG: ribosomal RNA small subunit methyltransferase I, partial [Rhodoferax sp.]|nr:ribosomal RNA small subunit methyltransferase I [Rhodoferax sp.]
MTTTPQNAGRVANGRLYLVPAPLDFGCDETVNLQNTMPWGTLTVASKLQYWICENAKSARAYLK